MPKPGASRLERIATPQEQGPLAPAVASKHDEICKNKRIPSQVVGPIQAHMTCFYERSSCADSTAPLHDPAQHIGFDTLPHRSPIKAGLSLDWQVKVIPIPIGKLPLARGLRAKWGGI